MRNEHYNITLKTPMGSKRGELVLEVKSNGLIGNLTVMGNNNHFSKGSIINEKFVFSGKLSTAVGKIDYAFEGIIDGDSLSGMVKTQKVNMLLTGTKT